MSVYTDLCISFKMRSVQLRVAGAAGISFFASSS